MNHYQTSSKNCARRIAGALVLLTSLATALQLFAQEQPEAREGEAEWQRDLLAFDGHVKGIASKARIPTAEEFEERMENARDEEEEVTFLPGGIAIVDYNPAKGTVQFELDEALQGKAVRWEMELVRDRGQSLFSGEEEVVLYPKRLWTPLLEAEAEGKPLGKDAPLVLFIEPFELPGLATKLFAGQRILVEGKLDWVGALYHMAGLPKEAPLPMTFWVDLSDVKVTRIDPTEEQLKTQILSDKADLDRKDWKVLEVNGKTEFDLDAALRAIDSESETAWHSGDGTGQPETPPSLLVDMGREEIVAGLRCAPPGAPDRYRDPFSGTRPDPTAGRVGKFSLHVANSRDELGEAVCSGTFTDYPAEHEVAFPEVKGRYFRFVVHTSADGISPAAVAELNLLAPPLEIPDSVREPALPPMAEEFERFALLYRLWETLPEALELSKDHPMSRRFPPYPNIYAEEYAEPWWNLKGEIYGMVARITEGDESVEDKIYRIAETQAHSQFGWANMLTVAASPEFSDDEDRKAMADLAGRMKVKRMEVLAAVKRTLTGPQQEQLKTILSKPAPVPPRPSRSRRRPGRISSRIRRVRGPSCRCCRSGIREMSRTAEPPSGRLAILTRSGSTR